MEEKLSRNLFCRPFTAVIVRTTATMPMMIPSVVRAPRAFRARMAAMATWNDSARSTASFTRLRPSLVPLGLLADGHHRPVLQVLGDGAIAPRDHDLAFLQPIHDLDQGVALDAGLDLLRDGLPSHDGEYDLHEPILVRLIALLRVLPLFTLHGQLIHRPGRNGLERHAERVLLGLGDDLGAGGHTGAQGLGRIDDADLDLEFGLLLGGA